MMHTTTLLILLMALPGSAIAPPEAADTAQVQLLNAPTHRANAGYWAMVYSIPVLVPLPLIVNQSFNENSSDGSTPDPLGNLNNEDSTNPLLEPLVQSQPLEAVIAVAQENELHDPLNLDWGIADIGPGVLSPNSYFPTSGGGGGGPGGQSGGGPAPLALSALPLPPLATVPEPHSIVMWGVAVLLVLLTRYRPRCASISFFPAS